MLTVWGRRSSSNVQLVMWCIAELELPFKRIDAGFTYGVVNTPEYLAMNPNGTVPTIQDGDQPPLWESSAIVRYLASRYGVSRFWPENHADRADIDRWAEWSKINVALNFTSPIFWPVARMPPERRNQDDIDKAIKQLNKYLGIADQRLSDCKFLVGNDFTLADIVFGHVLYRYYDLNIERQDFLNLERYYKMLVSRPAYAEHVMVDYSELKNSK